MTKFIKIVFYTLLLFSFIYQYDLTFFGLPSTFHSVRVSSCVIILLALISRCIYKKQNYGFEKKINKNIKAYFYFIIFLFLYSLLLLIVVGVGQGNYIYENLLNILLFSIPVALSLRILIKDINELCKVLFFTGILQSMIIVLCTFNDNFALLIDTIFNRNFFEFTREYRHAYAGGIGCITSTGVVRFSTCLFASAYLFLSSRKNVYLLFFLILSIVACMIARTGFIFFIIGMYVIMSSYFSAKSIIKIILSLISCSVIILLAISQFISIDELIQLRFNRFISLNETGLRKGFFDGYFYGEDTYLPPLNLDTILGTGLLSGLSADGYKVHVDGGPLRIYSAIGLPMCLFSYFFVLNIMFRLLKICKGSVNRKMLGMFFIFILVSDFKEISLFSVWPMCLYFTISYFIISKESINNESITCY